MVFDIFLCASSVFSLGPTLLSVVLLRLMKSTNRPIPTPSRSNGLPSSLALSVILVALVLKLVFNTSSLLFFNQAWKHLLCVGIHNWNPLRRQGTVLDDGIVSSWIPGYYVLIIFVGSYFTGGKHCASYCRASRTSSYSSTVLVHP